MDESRFVNEVSNFPGLEEVDRWEKQVEYVIVAKRN
jgi:hypothetical protein